jgi:hypothetical protein
MMIMIIIITTAGNHIGQGQQSSAISNLPYLFSSHVLLQ